MATSVRFNPGPEAYFEPSANTRAQIVSIIRFGIPSGLIVALPLFFLVLAFVGDPRLTLLTGGVGGFFIGFGLSIFHVEYPRNALPELLGNAVGDYIAPSGWQCYWLRPLGQLFLQATTGPRQVEERVVEDAETKNGTRFKITYKIRNYRVRWPMAYLRSIESSGVTNAPQVAMAKLLDTAVRKFTVLLDDRQMFQVDKINMLLANILSGEVDAFFADGEDPSTRFSISDDDPRKTIRSRLREYGLWIEVGGVDITNINEPDQVAQARAEIKEAEARNKALEIRVEHRSKLRNKFPGENIDLIEENVLVGSGDARMNLVRTSTGQPPGDFTVSQAIATNIPPDGAQGSD